MPEEFLQYIWESRLFNTDKLQTTNNEMVEILDTGRRNNDSGPDFFNAKVKIDNTIWAGNIEIHKKASDWKRHKHQNDKAYENVILHVVEDADEKIFWINGKEIPTIVLFYNDTYKQNYQSLLDAQTWIPCQEQFHKTDPIVLQLSYNRLMIERLEDKTIEIEKNLQRNNDNWNETFYQMLARMFGFNVNAMPFEMLARSLPLQILGKHKNNILQIEALLFGNSGMLNNQLLGDDYFINLREEYSFLHKKYKLQAIESHLWKFMRLRPRNFPTIRISQFAALIHQSHNLFSRIIEIKNIDTLKQLFKVNASDYWKNHYNFNKESSKTTLKELGEKSINLLIINTIIPFLFVFGEKQNKNYLKDRSLEFLDKLPPENNSTIRKWGELGAKSRTAFESQALLQLKKCYCEQKKCLNCHVGTKLITNRQN